MAAALKLPVSAYWSIECYFSIIRNLRFHFGFHQTTFEEWTCLLMAIHLRRSSLSVCLSWQTLMTGDRWDTRKGVTTWTLGAGHSLLLSVLGVNKAGLPPELHPRRICRCRVLDLGRICEDLCKQRTLSKLWEATVDINACQIFRIHTQLWFTNFI